MKAEVSVEGSSTSKSSSQSHMVVATMRIERYYSSTREEVSPLSDDAKALLNVQDYVGFFKACGPNYIRGIRRAQEITAIFKFKASSSEKAKEFAAGLKVSGWGQRVEAQFASASKFSESTSSLQIKILGYGLGLNEAGSDTLVATSLEEYNEVMKFAFQSFTQSENSYAIGMVYGMEVVPWVNNAAFQVEAKLNDDDIIIPVSRSLIPRVTTSGGCKNANYVLDKNNFCCDILSMYDPDNQVYNATLGSSDRICRPLRQLDRALIKENMSANGEFVARLDAAMRYKLAQLAVMERCVTAANSYPVQYNDNILKPQDSVEYNEVIDVSFSLMHMKIALDPLNNYGLVTHMAKELDEWIDMYYSPCMAALFGMNIDVSPETETRFFVAYPWHRHDECRRLSCLAVNMRWDRLNGGCVPSLIAGKNARAYNGVDTDKVNCAQDLDSDTGECAYDETELSDYYDDATACWSDKGLNGTTVDYFMGHFCMPELTGEKYSELYDVPAIASDCTSSRRRRLVQEEQDYSIEDNSVEDNWNGDYITPESNVKNLKYGY